MAGTTPVLSARLFIFVVQVPFVIVRGTCDSLVVFIFVIIIFYCLSSYTKPLNRPLSLYTFFFWTIFQSIKFRLLSFYFLVDSRPFLLVNSRTFVDSMNPRGFNELSWIWDYFQKQTCFVSCFLEIDVFYFLTFRHLAS